MHERRTRYRSWLGAIVIASMVGLMMTVGAYAANPDDELWVTVAGHGPGSAGSFWVTDLYIMNPNDEDEVDVMITFLPQAVDNSEAEGMEFEIGAGETLVLEDVVETLVGDEAIFGALHIEVLDPEDSAEDEAKGFFGSPPSRLEEDIEDLLEDDMPLLVHARVYDLQETGTKGQALEGIPSHAAIRAESTAATTHVLGIGVSDTFRSNWFGLNITQGDDDEPMPAEVLVEVLDTEGDVVASMSYMMEPFAPIFGNLASLVTALDDGTLRFTMLEGSGLFGASKIDRRTNDGTTLEAFWNLPETMDRQFTDEFMIEECTFTATGDNPFFPLQPGLEIVLEGEDEGVEIEVIVEVLDETFMVDGVMTRVVTETESEDGELIEISRNFFAQCVETGDVFYFGEEVDDYEDGEIVGHAGAWIAGENGNRAGIIMPGQPLVGSRYFQEVAPGIALDRAEHLATGLDVETEVGDFEGCIAVRDSTPLDPGEPGDLKVYCPGIGIVIDEDIEVVEFSEPD